MKKEFEEAYKKLWIKEEVLPKEWVSLYEIEACLKDSLYKKTFLLKSKSEDKKYIFKLAEQEEAEHLLEEGETLQKLQESENIYKTSSLEIDLKGLIYREDKAYLLRNYVEGNSLAEICNSCLLSDEEIFHIGILLSKAAAKLHHRKPPVIHRDIKPENVILKRDGSLVLIDFETARTYKKGKREDTYFAGTRETAAPEQYGFGQSDERTDIYGIGKTLLYMKTGDYFPDRSGRAFGNRILNRIIGKCCALDPDSRYSSVEKVIYELEKYLPDNRRGKKAIKILSVLTAVLFLMVLILSYQVFSLNMKADSYIYEERKEQKPQQDTEKDSRGRIIINGWDVTDYDLQLQQILDSCGKKDYQLMAKQCEQLISGLYADDFLKSVKTEDTFYYAADDERWESYQITRLGYEKVADSLAYHDRELENILENIAQYQYYIAASIRGMEESTMVDKEGNIQYTLLHQYGEENSEGKKEMDFSIHCLLEAIISGVELYDEENGK